MARQNTIRRRARRATRQVAKRVPVAPRGRRTQRVRRGVKRRVAASTPATVALKFRRTISRQAAALARRLNQNRSGHQVEDILAALGSDAAKLQAFLTLAEELGTQPAIAPAVPAAS